MTNATWAGRSATPPAPDGEKQRAGWVPVAGVFAALGLVGAGGYLLGTADGAETTAAPTTTVAEVVADNQADPADEPAESAVTTDGSASEAAEPDTTQDEAADSGDDGSSDDAVSEEPVADNTAADSATDDDATTAGDDSATRDGTANQVILDEGFSRGALLRDGVLYLGGAVPSQEVADQIIERAEAVVGEGNVVSEYVIDPTSDMGQGAPLYIDDVVLFAYGDNRYDHQFEPLLDLGLALLSQNPSVTVTIVTHTDASGSASFNERLSFERGQSVAQYWVDRGIPVEQIAIDARGESDPLVNDHTDEGAQLNRRAEFFIEGLLP